MFRTAKGDADPLVLRADHTVGISTAYVVCTQYSEVKFFRFFVSAHGKFARKRRSIDPAFLAEEQLIPRLAELGKELSSVGVYQLEALQRLDRMQKDMAGVMRRLEKLDGKWM